MPSVQDTESPKNVTRGSAPGARPGRRIGGTWPGFEVAAADGCGGAMTTGAATTDALGSGMVATPTSAATVAIAITVAPTGASRGTRRSQVPRRIGCSMT